MQPQWVVHLTKTNSFIQAHKHNPYTGQTLINVTTKFNKAKRFNSEFEASELLNYSMKHDGWVAKRADSFKPIFDFHNGRAQ